MTKRLCVTLAVIMLVISLAACTVSPGGKTALPGAPEQPGSSVTPSDGETPSASDIPPPPSPPPEPTPSFPPSPSVSPEPSPSASEEGYFLLDMELPGFLDVYEPECPLLPLVTSGSEAGYIVYGSAAFWDTRGGGVFRPEGAASFTALYDNWFFEKVQGYAVYDESHRVAFMSPSGEMLSGYDYWPVEGMFALEWDVYNARAVVADRLTGWRGTQKKGVADLRDGRSVLPAIYDDIQFWQTCIVASAEERTALFTYDGELLYDFGDMKFVTARHQFTGTEELGKYLSNWWEPGFILDIATDTVYGLDYCWEWAPQDDMYCHMNEKRLEALDLGYDGAFWKNNFTIGIQLYVDEETGIGAYERFDVLAHEDAALLMEDVFGVVRCPGNFDLIIVYIDANTCGILRDDGSFEPIEIDFEARRTFWCGC